MKKKMVKTHEEWKRSLSAEEFYILRLKGNEPAFTGQYYNYYKLTGNFYCTGCGMLLFNTADQFDAGNGLPTFTHPIDPDSLYTLPDHRFNIKRTEVLCKTCDSHLGFINDFRIDYDEISFCINSIAIRFSKD